MELQNRKLHCHTFASSFEIASDVFLRVNDVKYFGGREVMVSTLPEYRVEFSPNSKL